MTDKDESTHTPQKMFEYVHSFVGPICVKLPDGTVVTVQRKKKY